MIFKKRLNDLEKYFQLLTEKIPGAVYKYFYDEEWKLEFLSDAIYAMAGYPSDDFLGGKTRGLRDIIHPADKRMVNQTIEKSIKSKKEYTIEYRIYHADGTVRWVHEKGKVVYDEEGRHLNLEGIIIETTQAKIEKRRVKELEKNFNRLFLLPESTSGCVFELNTEGETVYSSSIAQELFPDLMRKGKDSVVVNGWQELLNALCNEGAKLLRREMKIDGCIYEQYISYIPEEKIIHFFMVDTSNCKILSPQISEKEIKKIAKKEDQSVNCQFLRNLSQDLRTPLTSVMGFSDLLMTTKLNKKQEEYIHSIKAGGTLLLDLLENIVEFSLIKMEKADLNMKDFNVDRLVREVFTSISSMFAQGIEKSYIHVDKNINFNIVGDPAVLKKILFHLVGSSIKFGAEGIGIIVSQEQPDPLEDNDIMLRFEIKSLDGMIPDELKKAILDVLTPGSSSADCNFGKTGLALSVCKSLVELMGGKISVSFESEAEEVNCFMFGMKFKKSEDELPELDFDFFKEELGGKKILIIDDYEGTRKILKIYCEDFGLDVISTVESGEEALERLSQLSSEENFPDIILCDILMPNLNGHEFLREFRTQYLYSPTQVIAVTSDIQLRLAQNMKENRFDGFLSKPVSREDLGKSLSFVLKY